MGTSRGTSQSPATPGSTATLPTVTGSSAPSIDTFPTALPPISPGPSSPVTSSPAPGSAASTTAPTAASASPELRAVLGRVESGGIRFAYRSDDLSPAAVPLLDELALRLNREVPVRLSVAGHTDSDGAPADNAELSARRAAAVVDHLVARGVAAGRLEIRAAGHLEPLADNTSDAGRSANRRVEIKLLGAGG